MSVAPNCLLLLLMMMMTSPSRLLVDKKLLTKVWQEHLLKELKPDITEREKTEGEYLSNLDRKSTEQMLGGEMSHLIEKHPKETQPEITLRISPLPTNVRNEDQLFKREYEGNSLQTYSEEKRKSKYDPALRFLGLRKRIRNNHQLLKYLPSDEITPSWDSSKSRTFHQNGVTYNPEIQQIGHKRLSVYEPSFKFIELGKPSSTLDPMLENTATPHNNVRYSNLGMCCSNYSPSFKLEDLRKSNYNLPFNFFDIIACGLTAQFMRFGKYWLMDKDLKFGYDVDTTRDSNRDLFSKLKDLQKPRLVNRSECKLLVLSERKHNYDHLLKVMGFENIDPSLRIDTLRDIYLKQDTRNESNKDDAPNIVNQATISTSSDPSMKFHKRLFQKNPTFKSKHDQFLNHDIIFKDKNEPFGQTNPTFELLNSKSLTPVYSPIANLGSRYRKFNGKRIKDRGKQQKMYDPALRFMGLGKRNFNLQKNKVNDLRLHNMKERHIEPMSSDYLMMLEDPQLHRHLKKKRSIGTLYNMNEANGIDSIKRRRFVYPIRFGSHLVASQFGLPRDLDSRQNSQSRSFNTSWKYDDDAAIGSMCSTKSNPIIKTDFGISQVPSEFQSSVKNFNYDSLQVSNPFISTEIQKRKPRSYPKLNPGWKFIGLGKRLYRKNLNINLQNKDKMKNVYANRGFPFSHSNGHNLEKSPRKIFKDIGMSNKGLHEPSTVIGSRTDIPGSDGKAGEIMVQKHDKNIPYAPWINL